MKLCKIYVDQNIKHDPYLKAMLACITTVSAYSCRIVGRGTTSWSDYRTVTRNSSSSEGEIRGFTSSQGIDNNGTISRHTQIQGWTQQLEAMLLWARSRRDTPLLLNKCVAD